MEHQRTNIGQQGDGQQAKARRAVIVLLLVLGIPALLVGVYMLTLGRSPLAGVDHHDFGVIPIVGEGRGAEGWAEHTFVLTNRSRSTLRINEIRTSCNCTNTRYNTETLEPGEQLEVGVAMEVTRSGLAEENVYIVIDGRGVRTLTVTGVGRMQQQLRAPRSDLVLVEDQPQTLTVFAEIWPGELPEGATEPDLHAAGPDGLEIRLDRLSQTTPARIERRSPAVWTAQYTVSAPAGQLPDDAELVITMQPDQQLRIPVRIWKRPEQPDAMQPQEQRPFNPLEFVPGSEPESAPDDR